MEINNNFRSNNNEKKKTGKNNNNNKKKYNNAKNMHNEINTDIKLEENSKNNKNFTITNHASLDILTLLSPPPYYHLMTNHHSAQWSCDHNNSIKTEVFCIKELSLWTSVSLDCLKC